MHDFKKKLSMMLAILISIITTAGCKTPIEIPETPSPVISQEKPSPEVPPVTDTGRDSTHHDTGDFDDKSVTESPALPHDDSHPKTSPKQNTQKHPRSSDAAQNPSPSVSTGNENKPQPPAGSGTTPPVVTDPNKEHLVSFTPVTELHPGGNCDLSEYIAGYRTTQQAESYETERFCVNIEAGCTIPENLNALLDKYIRFTEEATGMSLDSAYAKSISVGKITFSIQKEGFSETTANTVYLNPHETLAYNGNPDVLIQCLTQCLALRNGPYMGNVLTSGYCAYISVLTQDTGLPRLSRPAANYSYYEQEINAQNAETLFQTAIG